MPKLTFILCLVGLLAFYLIRRYMSLMRTAARPEIAAAVGWWIKTIEGIARSQGNVLTASGKKLFIRAVSLQLAKTYRKDGYYPMLSSSREQPSPALADGLQASRLSTRWLPADVAMIVYRDSICVRCGTDREEPLQQNWTRPPRTETLVCI